MAITAPAAEGLTHQTSLSIGNPIQAFFFAKGDSIFEQPFRDRIIGVEYEKVLDTFGEILEMIFQVFEGIIVML
jgi:hypothetical protein